MKNSGKGRKIVLMVLIGMMVLAETAFAQAGKENKNIKLRDALSVIHSRKSVRSYLDKPIAKEDLLTILKAGMAAPTAMDKRPWAFVAVTDRKVLNKLADGLPYSKMLYHAGAAIVVCGVMEKALSGPMQEFWIQDCAAASENILLAVEALGLGAVWTGMYPMPDNMKYVRETLGVPDNVIPLNVIPIGYPKGEEEPKDKFDPANIHWDKW